MSLVPCPVGHVICPYNKSHVIRQERIQFHLTKCLPNAGDKRFVVCPFNSTHLIPSTEINNHKTNLCPDRISLDTFLCDIVDSKPLFEVNKIEVECKENWDDGPKFSYDAEKVLREKKLLVLKQCAPPAERKRFIAEQRKKFQSFPDEEPICVSKNNKSKIRPPNSTSMAMNVPNKKTGTENVPNKKAGTENVQVVQEKVNFTNADEIEKKTTTDNFELVVSKKKNKKSNQKGAAKTTDNQTVKNQQKAVKQPPNKNLTSNLDVTKEEPKNEAINENVVVKSEEDEFIVVTKKKNKSRKN